MDISTVGVIGAGVMGSGIAQTLATAGLRVSCFDTSAAQLERARTETVAGRYGLDRGVARGKISAEQASLARGLLTFTDSFEGAVTSADLVIEAVPERIGLKIEIFRRLDHLAPARAILASNTSGLSITGLAAATDRPGQVIGWHWSSPPPVMRFAEIVVTAHTSAETVEAIRTLATACGKNPIVVHDIPPVRSPVLKWGFAANRVLWAMLEEARQVVADGVCSERDLDQLMVDCLNWPVGPFTMLHGANDGWAEAATAAPAG
ncbi:MAG: 3-hydroxyacyl-CoA dehydrogenase family protein [Candidatus Dormibacteria bacterium]